jgi:hypothetical protein
MRPAPVPRRVPEVRDTKADLEAVRDLVRHIRLAMARLRAEEAMRRAAV